VSTRSDVRPLGPDELAALEDQRDFLLASLDDLEREHAAGDVDEHDYAELRDDYTARAAKVLRAIESHEARVAPSSGSSAKPEWRRLAIAGGIGLFAVATGLVLALGLGRRGEGDTVTGAIRQSENAGSSAGQTDMPEWFDEAASLTQAGRLDDAIAIYDDVLADEPDNVLALTFKGWLQFQNGDGSGLTTMIHAAETDPEYPDVHFFIAVAFNRLGRPDVALESLDRLDELGPPAELAQAAEQLRTQIEATPTTAGG
jgi:tetratricopeptide (TPR) repeat protein